MRTFTKSLLMSLLLLVVGQICAESPKVLMEMDWSTATEYPYYWLGDGYDMPYLCNKTASVQVVDGALVINNSQEQNNNYDVLTMILDFFGTTEDEEYTINIWMKATMDGYADLNIGGWLVDKYVEKRLDFTASDDYQLYTIHFTSNITQADGEHIIFMMGKTVGTVFIKKVQLVQNTIRKNNTLYISEGHRLLTTKVNTLPINLNNEDEIVGFQFDVVLPQGMTLAKNGKINDVNVTDRTAYHSLSSNVLPDGSIRIIGTNMNNESIDGVDGALVKIGVEVASWVANGDYDIQLKNIKMANINKQAVICKDMSYKVTVISNKMGDVNCDDDINVTDVVLIIDDILGKNPTNYEPSLADVDDDGIIDVTDVVTVIDVILGKIDLSRTVTCAEKDLSAYTAFQVDLTIPVGYTFENVELTEIAKEGHKLDYNMQDDGRCRVVIFSMSNEALPCAWNEMIRLNLRGQGEALVNADSGVFVTIGRERHELMLNGTANIAELSTLNSPLPAVYDLQGHKVENTAKGLYIINGKKTIKK